MPPGVGLTEPDKTRLIAYLSKLIAETPQASPTPTPTPTPVSYSFDTAKVLCTGCHGKNQRRPQLTTIDQWRDKKTKILNAVKDKSMPRGKELTEAERGALVRFIESL
jgi:hypothetical protein